MNDEGDVICLCGLWRVHEDELKYHTLQGITLLVDTSAMGPRSD